MQSRSVDNQIQLYDSCDLNYYGSEKFLRTVFFLQRISNSWINKENIWLPLVMEDNVSLINFEM